MSGFWKFLLIIVIIAGVMLVITFTIPDVARYAKDLAGKNKLPVWIVGLFAPIAYVFRMFSEWLNKLLGTSSTEQSIQDRNEELKVKVKSLEDEVNKLDEWRRTEIDKRKSDIDRFNANIASMDQRAGAIDAQIQDLQAERERLKGSISVIDG